MKIRITGTKEELEGITELLKEKPYIRSISSLYKNRGELNKDYRLYIETYDLQREFFQDPGNLLSNAQNSQIEKR